MKLQIAKRTATTPAETFTAVISRLGQTTVAAGPYRSRSFADLVAFRIRQTLADTHPIVDVAPYDEELLHLPGDPEALPLLLAAVDGQPANRDTRRTLARAHAELSVRLFADA